MSVSTSTSVGTTSSSHKPTTSFGGDINSFGAGETEMYRQNPTALINTDIARLVESCRSIAQSGDYERQHTPASRGDFDGCYQGCRDSGDTFRSRLLRMNLMSPPRMSLACEMRMSLPTLVLVETLMEVCEPNPLNTDVSKGLVCAASWSVNTM